MLILTRKLDESIMINNNIEVKVVKVQGNQVHLGIDAPRTVSIYREEIYKQIREENQKAVKASANDDAMKLLENSLSGMFSK